MRINTKKLTILSALAKLFQILFCHKWKPQIMFLQRGEETEQNTYSNNFISLAINLQTIISNSFGGDFREANNL